MSRTREYARITGRYARKENLSRERDIKREKLSPLSIDGLLERLTSTTTIKNIRR